MDVPAIEDSHEIVFRRNEHELAAVPVAGEDPGLAAFVNGHPPLVSIAWIPAVPLRRHVRDDRSCGGLHPFPRDDLPAVPFAVAKEEVADAGQVVGGQVQPALGIDLAVQ